jgi:hypothetical protein
MLRSLVLMMFPRASGSVCRRQADHRAKLGADPEQRAIGSRPRYSRGAVEGGRERQKECRRMPYRPNYRLGRAERDRVKKAKQEEKIKQRQERSAARKMESRDDELPEPAEEG